MNCVEGKSGGILIQVFKEACSSFFNKKNLNLKSKALSAKDKKLQYANFTRQSSGSV